MAGVESKIVNADIAYIVASLILAKKRYVAKTGIAGSLGDLDARASVTTLI